MGLSKAVGSYDDCRQLLDKALASEKGIKITRESAGAAKHLRHRMNAYRAQTRRQSMTMYEPGNPAYNVSPYDGLVLRVVENVIYVEPASIEGLQIEEIT